MKPDDPLGSRILAIKQKLVGTFMECLESKSAEERLKGVQGLENLRRVAVPAVPALETLLSDPDARVRKAAKKALLQIREVADGQ